MQLPHLVKRSPRACALDRKQDKETKQSKENKDMSENNYDESNFDLDIDLADVDTSTPALRPGKVEMVITKADITNGTKNPSEKYLALQLKSVNEETGTKGETLKPGQLMYYRLPLQTHEKAFEDFRKGLARLSVAAFGEQVKFNMEFVASLPGKIVLATIKASKNTDFGECEIKGLEAAE